MALIDVPPLCWPMSPGYAAVSTNSLTLGAANSGVAALFRAPRTGTVRYLDWYLNAVTSPVLTVTGGFQGVAAGGIPDGTFSNSTTKSSGFATGDWMAFDLGAGTGTAVTAGGLYCAAATVTAYTSGSVAPNYRTSTQEYGGAAQFAPQAAWTATQSAGTWTKVSGNTPGGFRVRYDDGVVGQTFLWYPAASLAAISFLSSSTPNEYGNLFTLPFSARLIGVAFQDRLVDSAAITVYDSGLAVKATRTLAATDLASTSVGALVHALFATPVTLAAGTYAAAVRALTTTATNVRVSLLTVPAAGDMAYLPGGTGCYGVKRTYSTGTEAWTTEPTRRYAVVPIFDQIADPAAAYTAASNVRSGTDRGDGTLGTLAVPPAADVLTGVAVDATTGTLTIPTASQALTTATFGVGGTSVTGNVVMPPAGSVKLGDAYGPASGTTGTYAPTTVLGAATNRSGQSNRIR